MSFTLTDEETDYDNLVRYMQLVDGDDGCEEACCVVVVGNRGHILTSATRDRRHRGR